MEKSSTSPSVLWINYEQIIKDKLGIKKDEKQAGAILVKRIESFFNNLTTSFIIKDNLIYNSDTLEYYKIVNTPKSLLIQPISIFSKDDIICNKYIQYFIQVTNGILRVDILNYLKEDDLSTNFYFYNSLLPYLDKDKNYSSLYEFICDTTAKVEPDISIISQILSDIFYMPYYHKITISKRNKMKECPFSAGNENQKTTTLNIEDILAHHFEYINKETEFIYQDAPVRKLTNN